jgi:predicted dienelactone hydrolase
MIDHMRRDTTSTGHDVHALEIALIGEDFGGSSAIELATARLFAAEGDEDGSSRTF